MDGAAPPVLPALPVAPSHRANAAAPGLSSTQNPGQDSSPRSACRCHSCVTLHGSTWNRSRSCSWRGRSGTMPPASPARTSLFVTSRQLCLRQEAPPAASPSPAPRPACREQNIRLTQHPEPAGILPPALPLRCSTVLHLLPTLTPEHGACLRDLGTASAHPGTLCCQEVRNWPLKSNKKL